MEEIAKQVRTVPQIKLLPGERIVDIYFHEPRPLHANPSSLQQMMRLTGVSAPDQIGSHGPSVAALAFDVSARTSVEPGESPLHEPTATIPVAAPEHLRLYEVIFGRDALRVATELMTQYPELARTTTLRLAELQGVTYDTKREEEPGRILHEARDSDDPIARELSKRRGWGWPYYGSVDATPEFIRTVAAYCRLSEENHAFLSEEYLDRNNKIRSMAYAFDMAIEWMLGRLNANPEGLLEYRSVLPKGIENQVWKDSWDAYHHSDGQLANHGKGIASIEVQVSTFDALLDAADIYENVLDDTDRAAQLRARGERLKNTIMELFWTDEKGGYFVLGTDRDEHNRPRQLKIRTSNMGHTLHSRLLEGDDPEVMRRRGAVVAHLLSPEMLNVSGIRTLASDELRFRPGAYHNGSVWLWDTHHIARGLRRHGYLEHTYDLDKRLLNVVDVTKMFPEYVRGDDNPAPTINTATIILDDDTNHRQNVIEQPPQEVQAWTVAAILAIKKRLGEKGLLSPHPDYPSR